jgi:hypothetical protein
MADRHFNLNQLDQEKFIKANNLKPITNPVMFNAGNGPTPDGLLSNEIFGITQAERSGIFSYINLNGEFIQPYYYKIWLKIDRNLRGCIYETQTFIIDSNGFLIPDDNGETGLKFLKNNIDKIKFKNTKKDAFLKVLLNAKEDGSLFTSKFIIIPPYYRDVNTNTNGKIGVGEINKLYINLLNTTKALTDSNDYGLGMTGGIKGRIQDLMLEIYNWFTVGESIIGGEHTGSGIFKKFGVQRRSVMAKTTDYSARLVLSSPKINENSIKDLMVDMDYSAIPLSACCVIAYPYIIYELRQYFQNEFGGKTLYNFDNSDKAIELDNPQIAFSDERFDKELNEFIHGYSNRIKAIKLPTKTNRDATLRFMGYNITEDEYRNGKRETASIINRDMTWLDILYRAAVAATEDKMAMITRYPMDSYFNQLYTHIRVSSTIETEPMVINGKFYRWYPKIRQTDIGKDTSNMFIDTCQIANPYCGLMGADFDGDQVTVKMAYSVEANNELKKYNDSKAQFITLAGENGRKAEKEALQAIYNLTLVLPDTKLTNPQF